MLIISVSAIIGSVLALSLLFGAMAMGVGIGEYIDIPSVLLSFGVPVGLMMFSYPGYIVKDFAAIIKRSFFTYAFPVKNLDNFFEELLLYENGFDPIPKKEDKIQILKHLQDKKNSLVDRHTTKQEMLSFLGKSSLLVGILSSIIALVAMLFNIDHMYSVGPSVAVIIMTVFYSLWIFIFLFTVVKKLQIETKREVEILDLLEEYIQLDEKKGAKEFLLEKENLGLNISYYIEPTLTDEVREQLYKEKKVEYNKILLSVIVSVAISLIIAVIIIVLGFNSKSNKIDMYSLYFTEKYYSTDLRDTYNKGNDLLCKSKDYGYRIINKDDGNMYKFIFSERLIVNKTKNEAYFLQSCKKLDYNETNSDILYYFENIDNVKEEFVDFGLM